MGKRKRRSVGTGAPAEIDLGSRLCPGRLLLQLSLDGLGQLPGLRLDGGLEAGDDLAVAADEEFREVPLDRPTRTRIGFLGGEVLVQRRDTFPLDNNLGEHGEGDSIL